MQPAYSLRFTLIFTTLILAGLVSLGVTLGIAQTITGANEALKYKQYKESVFKFEYASDWNLFTENERTQFKNNSRRNHGSSSCNIMANQRDTRL